MTRVPPFIHAEGTVVELTDDKVHVLAEYGRYKERRLCVVSRAFWPVDHPPQERQRCTIEFRPDETFPRIRVLPLPSVRLSIRREDAIADARDLLGIAAGDNVTVVIGGTNKNSPEATDRYSVRWGEAVALSRIPPLLQVCQVPPENVRYAFADPLSDHDPHRYANTHVIFLGSVRANAVLKEHFWPWLDLKHSIPADGTPRLRFDSAAGRKELPYEKRQPQPPAAATGLTENIHVIDPFFVAVTANPFDSERYHRCILCCGCATFGTAYAAVVLTARPTVERLAETYCYADARRPAWETAWTAEVRGAAGALEDTVACWTGWKAVAQLRLENLYSAPAVWSPAPWTDEEEDPISRALQVYGQAP